LHRNRFACIALVDSEIVNLSDPNKIVQGAFSAVLDVEEAGKVCQALLTMLKDATTLIAGG